MATFALYNYEFEQLPDDDFFGKPLRKQLSDESFAHRQARFGQLLMDDYSGTKPLIYANKRGTQYIHQFIAKPDDGIFAMMLLNNHKRTTHDKSLQPHRIDDYRRCIVFVDNRPGIQRLAIAVNPAAFTKLSTVENILFHTLSVALASRFAITIRLEHLFQAARFWDIVGDSFTYPKGFQKVVFSWPKPNLDRINKRIEFIRGARMGTKSKICIIADARKGFSAVIDKQDEWLTGMVDAASEVGGDGSITLLPNGMKRTILVGKDSYKYVNFSDATISSCFRHWDTQISRLGGHIDQIIKFTLFLIHSKYPLHCLLGSSMNVADSIHVLCWCLRTRYGDARFRSS